MKYTIQLPATITLVLEADNPEAALDKAAEHWHNACVDIDCDFQIEEAWESPEIYDEEGEEITDY